MARTVEAVVRRQSQASRSRLQALERSRSLVVSYFSASIPANCPAAWLFIIPRTRRTERVSRLVLMRAIEREEIEVAYAGDICAVVGVKEVITGDTLCDEDFDIRLEPPSFPEPVISMSIEPNTRRAIKKSSASLSSAWWPRIRRSASRPTKTPVKPFSPAWASCTLRSSSTA